jgi:autoinducer 2-degrading protein
MLILHVHARVKPEFVEAFKQATVENAAESLKEAGVARFDVVQQSDDPTRFVLIEVYRDAAAPAKHKETAHYQKWAAEVADMLAEPRARNTYSNVFPPDGGW